MLSFKVKSLFNLHRTLSIECCSEISINLVFRSQCYFASIFYSTAYVFLYNQCLFSFLHFILCRMCVCHMFNKVLTYLLTYLLDSLESISSCLFVLSSSVHSFKQSNLSSCLSFDIINHFYEPPLYLLDQLLVFYTQ